MCVLGEPGLLLLRLLLLRRLVLLLVRWWLGLWHGGGSGQRHLSVTGGRHDSHRGQVWC